MNWKTPITLLVLLGVLLGAAFYGWQTIIAPATGDNDEASPSKPSPSCAKVVHFRKGQLIRAKDIRVNVYNAGLISGLAADTISQLHARGFRPGVADNAPGNIPVTNVTIVMKPSEAPEVRLVQQQFKGKVRVIKRHSLRAGVDIVIGDNFHAVDSTARTAIRLKRHVTSCAKRSG